MGIDQSSKVSNFSPDFVVLKTWKLARVEKCNNFYLKIRICNFVHLINSKIFITFTSIQNINISALKKNVSTIKKKQKKNRDLGFELKILMSSVCSAYKHIAYDVLFWMADLKIYFAKICKSLIFILDWLNLFLFCNKNFAAIDKYFFF